MNKIFYDLNTLKLFLLDNHKLVIENYNNINEVSNVSIMIDKYLIKGTGLSIELLNSYQIILSGNIEDIQIL